MLTLEKNKTISATIDTDDRAFTIAYSDWSKSASFVSFSIEQKNTASTIHPVRLTRTDAFRMRVLLECQINDLFESRAYTYDDSRMNGSFVRFDTNTDKSVTFSLYDCYDIVSIRVSKADAQSVIDLLKEVELAK